MVYNYSIINLLTYFNWRKNVKKIWKNWNFWHGPCFSRTVPISLILLKILYFPKIFFTAIENQKKTLPASENCLFLPWLLFSSTSLPDLIKMSSIVSFEFWCRRIFPWSSFRRSPWPKPEWNWAIKPLLSWMSTSSNIFTKTCQQINGMGITC